MNDKIFQFTSLAFGISSAPFIFTKLLNPLVKKWRKAGFNIVVFLDDGFCIGKSFESLKSISDIVHKDLLDAGFLPNYEKSVWNPVKVTEWLGFRWNMLTGLLEINDKKLNDFKMVIFELISHRKLITGRKLAKVTGKIISFTNSLGDICRLKSRHLHFAIINRLSWDTTLEISSGCFKELLFWYNNICLLPFQKMLKTDFIANVSLFVDASAHSCGGYCVELDNKIFHHSFSKVEILKSFTYRELQAVLLALQSYIYQLSYSKVSIYTDNQNVARILRVGSRVKELQVIALSIFDLSQVFSFQFSCQWIPRDQNKSADQFSRIIDHDDRSVSLDIFQQFNKVWGPYTCDLFANDKI